MKRLLVVLIFMMLGVFGAIGQVTLDECQLLARRNFPAIKRYELIVLSEKYKLSEISKGWIPQSSMNSRATYQSSVTGLGISMPGLDIDPINKFQYQATLDVNQTLWDGGSMRASRLGVRASSIVENSSLEVDLYGLRDRVNNLYFGVLLSCEQLRLNGRYIENLKENLAKVSAQALSGVSSQSDVDAVQVGIVQAEQDDINIRYSLASYRDMLSLMIGRDLGDDTLAVPMFFSIDTSGVVSRPELSLFDSQLQLAESQVSIINASTMPKLNAYAQAGIGQPGLNMLSGGMGQWAMGGVKLSWNFGAFYTKKDAKEQVEVAKRNVENNREVFLYNVELQMTQHYRQIESYQAAMKADDRIISLLESVERSSSAKLENGSIGATDFMRDALATQIARQNKALRQMQLLVEIYNLKNTLNQ